MAGGFGRLSVATMATLGVGVEGHAGAGVAEDPADLDDVEADVDNQVAGEGVSQVVEANPPAPATGTASETARASIEASAKNCFLILFPFVLGRARLPAPWGNLNAHSRFASTRVATGVRSRCVVADRRQRARSPWWRKTVEKLDVPEHAPYLVHIRITAVDTNRSRGRNEKSTVSAPDW